MPHTLNTMMFFYRKDLFDAAGKSPPKTFAEYRDAGEVVQQSRFGPAMSVA